MSFLDLAKKRYSVRKYLDKPVEEEKLERVLQAGRVAPSARNSQPWKIYVIRDKENLEKIAEAYPRPWFKEAPVVLVICGDHSKSWVKSNGKDHCDIDVAILTDHITLAAAEEGLGTCWVCAFDSEKCSEILGLGENIEPIVVLPLGYPFGEADTTRHDKDRLPLNEIINWEF
jgi:nitroreductase